MSPQKNQSGEIVRSVWRQLFVKYGLCNSQWVEILSEGGLIFQNMSLYNIHRISQPNRQIIL